MAKLAFIGLGVMGFPMAGHVAAAGHEVTVYNRTRAKAEAWIKRHGGALAATPAEAAAGADAVFACVGDVDDVRAVTIGDHGAFSTMRDGALFVDHTTASAELARELSEEAAARGLMWLDAPVSGGQAGAENGQLTIMCGGSPAAYDAAAPLMAAYARKHALLGPAGAGQLAKMVNQICIGGLIQALAEAVHFCQRAGLDVQQVFEVLREGAAQSWQMDNRAATMARGAFDFGFAIDWMRKDFRICLEEARANGARLPVTALVDQFYAQLQAKGYGRMDTSALIALLEEGD
ncbi:MAG TPA: NAD(P)-dependent oxidoreductase [Thermopetrobacter sp.]|nr:NAD(P)-dependent oxidoreductase [Thermopetrobacter sp.]